MVRFNLLELTPQFYVRYDKDGNDCWDNFLQEKFAPEIYSPDVVIVAPPTEDISFTIGYTQTIKPFRIRFKGFVRNQIRLRRNRATTIKSIFRK